MMSFGFGVVGFQFWGGGVPRSASCWVCVSGLICFAGVSGYVSGFIARNEFLTQRLLERGCWCHGLRGAFSGFFMDDAVVWCLCSGLGLGLSCVVGFWGLGSVVAWCVD